MKSAPVLSFSLLLAAAAAAPVHVHHQHKRDVVHVTETVLVQVNADGTPEQTAAPANVDPANLVGNSNVDSTDAAAAAPAAAPAPADTPAAAPAPAETSQAPVAAPVAPESNQQKQASSGDAPASTGSGSFSDGTIPCSQFPSDYGAVPVEWINLSGWASVMSMDGSTANDCQEGFYCSYACPAGQSKTQWPSNQPADGRSVGGLLCKGGYLYRSNTATNNLCESDVGSGIAKSELSQDVAMCRTDYPGSENMVIPTLVKAGGQADLSVVNEDTYYVWKGMKTSTQYYVNNAGVSVEDGCVWGQPGSGVGNWAPLVVGAGYTNGLSYISLIPNPNNSSPANFNVRIEATPGSSINGDCKYENGSFSGGNGCTVTVTSGSAQLVFY